MVSLAQVQEELKAVGVGRVGFIAPESREIAKLLDDNEHIGGVVYGKYPNGLAWLVATNKRIIFIDKKPLFRSIDELTYEVISGVKLTKGGLLTGVVLHSRVGDYALRYVSPKCAKIFIEYIERRRLESEKSSAAQPEVPHLVSVVPEGLEFIRSQELAVLSTVDRTGNVHGAVVYYLVDQNSYFYILTKSDTNKGRNAIAHSQVALTVHRSGSLETAQVQGVAEVENDAKVRDWVFTNLIKPRVYEGQTHLPPVTKLQDGSYVVIRIKPTQISYHDYSKR